MSCIEITVTKKMAECKRCGHVWENRKSIDDVKMCPRCKSYKWREEKKG